MIYITELSSMNIVPTRLNWSMVLGITYNVTVPGEFDHLQRVRTVALAITINLFMTKSVHGVFNLKPGTAVPGVFDHKPPCP